MSQQPSAAQQVKDISLFTLFT